MGFLEDRAGLTGKVALIAGGGGGLGRAIALDYARAAMHLVLWDKNPDLLELTVRDVKKSMPTFLFGFLGLAVVRTLVDHLGLMPPAAWATVLAVVAWAAKALILVAMAGIGLSTRFGAMRSVGGAPLLVGFIGATFLGVASYFLIHFSGAGL